MIVTTYKIIKLRRKKHEEQRLFNSKTGRIDEFSVLTANEMAERLAEDGWNNVTLFKTVQSLTTDGYLEVVGLEKTVKTYARKLAPSMSKDDYYASVLIKRGIDSSSIANITAALIGAKDKQAKEKNAEVIAKLEEIIDTLKNDEE
jgi:hypothetical protein